MVAADRGVGQGVVELAGCLCGVGEVVGAGEEGLVLADFADQVVHGVLACAAVGGRARGPNGEGMR